MFEQLEARQLLSAVLENGTLTINGTDEADTITLEERVITTSAPTTGSDWICDNWAKIEYVLIAKVNGVEQRFSYDDVQRVVINGLGGDDTIGGPERMYLISPVADGHDGSGRGFPQFIYGGDGNDTIIGGMGNDSIDGGTGNDVIYDVVGRNTLMGGGGVDEITDGSGPDTPIGGAVYDLLNAGGGSDQFFDETGQLPSVVLENGTLTINGTDGADSIRLYHDNLDRMGFTDGEFYVGPPLGIIVDINGTSEVFDARNVRRIVINGLDGDDTIESRGPVIFSWTNLSSQFTQFIDGGDGNDTIICYGQNDSVAGGEGNDTITCSTGNDSIDGGNGNDVIRDDSGRNTLRGGEGNDEITGGSGADTLRGGGGDDLLDGGEGNNQLYGEAGNDTLKAGQGTDVFSGGAGADTADYSDRVWHLNLSIDGVANDGNQPALIAAVIGIDPKNIPPLEQDNILTDVENLIGGSGSDHLIGSDANNRLCGGPGNDTLTGGGGADVLFGNEGIDAVDYSDHAQGVTVTLDGRRNDGSRRERDWVRADVENILGSKFGDVLIGNSGTNRLEGGAGDDILLGGAGIDTLMGGLGNDQMDGGQGNDILYGYDMVHKVSTGPDRDTVIGGRGSDAAWNTRGDILRGVEHHDD